MATKLLILALAGALGTLSRYGLAGLVQKYAGTTFPWGTFAVNMLGTFLFGVVWIAATQRGLLSPEARLYILVGFMGAFTTFSTYMFESGQFLQDSQIWPCLANILGQVVAGIICLFLGFAAGRLL